MYKLVTGFELPETDEEFSYIEVGGGIDELVDNFISESLTKDKNLRKILAIDFSRWFILHWKTLHRMKMIKVYKDKEESFPQRRYRIALGTTSKSALEVLLPCVQDDVEVQVLAAQLEYIIKFCGYKELT